MKFKLDKETKNKIANTVNPVLSKEAAEADKEGQQILVVIRPHYDQETIKNSINNFLQNNKNVKQASTNDFIKAANDYTYYYISHHYKANIGREDNIFTVWLIPHGSKQDVVNTLIKKLTNIPGVTAKPFADYGSTSIEVTLNQINKAVIHVIGGYVNIELSDNDIMSPIQIGSDDEADTLHKVIQTIRPYFDHSLEDLELK